MLTKELSRYCNTLLQHATATHRNSDDKSRCRQRSSHMPATHYCNTLLQHTTATHRNNDESGCRRRSSYASASKWCVASCWCPKSTRTKRRMLPCSKHSRQTCCTRKLCVAVCCSVLQCAAVCCSVLQCVAVCCFVQNMCTTDLMHT